MVSIAVAEEKELLYAGSLFQADRVVAEEFSGNADQRDLSIEQRHGEPWTDAIGVFIGVIRNKLWKKGE